MYRSSGGALGVQEQPFPGEPFQGLSGSFPCHLIQEKQAQRRPEKHTQVARSRVVRQAGPLPENETRIELGLLELTTIINLGLRGYVYVGLVSR